jgi:hypothetical protein
MKIGMKRKVVLLVEATIVVVVVVRGATLRLRLTNRKCSFPFAFSEPPPWL